MRGSLWRDKPEYKALNGVVVKKGIHYAILHGAKAALQFQGIAAESHIAVERLFGFHLVQTGLIKPDWGSLDLRLTVGLRPGRWRLLQIVQRPLDLGVAPFAVRPTNSSADRRPGKTC